MVIQNAPNVDSYQIVQMHWLIQIFAGRTWAEIHTCSQTFSDGHVLRAKIIEQPALLHSLIRISIWHILDSKGCSFFTTKTKNMISDCAGAQADESLLGAHVGTHIEIIT